MSRGSASMGISVATCVVLTAIGFPVSAQITSATVSGTVKDAQGGVLPGATVILINEGQGTRSAPAVTSGTGDFVLVNIASGTYTVQVEMPSFKVLKRSGLAVSPGSHVALGTLTLDVGGTTEVVDVKGETPVIQSSSGERSYTVSPDEVANLPLSDRNFATLASLAPGVSGTSRIGGGGATNFMMDGVGTMDTGSNRLLVNVNVESIAQVKVLTSSYQAEYGRSSGLQITAVTKSGTNRFRGSAYDVERNSDWNPNSKVNKLNGDPKATSKQREWGYSIGGPIGKPGGTNKLFFFYAQEFQPRTQGNNVSRFRFPTALERAGDFSETTDNNGRLYPYIRDPEAAGVCNPTDQTACFHDGDVLGRIPADRLYETGLNILKMFPMPNTTSAPGAAYNYEIIRPNESLLAYQPAVRLDYQPIARLRASFKYTGWSQRQETINGSLPGFNDTRMQHPVVSTMVVTANYNLGPTTFLEGTYGRSGNEQAGCALTGAGPNFCTGGLPMNPISNRVNAGLDTLPFLFPDANILNPNYYAYGVLNDVRPPIWDGTRIQMTPGFSWGGRVANAPPNVPFPGFLNVNRTQDVSISLTKVAGRHTMKTGFYNTHSFKAQQRGGWSGNVNFGQDAVGTNPYDTSFGFSNAAIGSFSSFNQASRYVEGLFVYNNTEGYIQDNWKVNSRLTLDYGVRLVHQQPQYDTLGQASNFLPEKWDAAQAPVLYVAGCVNGANPCTGTNRQARNPLTGQLLGRNSTLAIGTLVPGSGNTTNGLFLSGQGISSTTYTWPMLKFAPRFGIAYDVTGRQRFVVRGGAGLYYDRPDGNAIFPQVENPPTYKNITVRYGQLQTLGRGGLTTEGPPALAVYEYDSKLPASWQWNAGIQTMLPWVIALDMSYVGQHSHNTLQSVNLNSVDLGTAFLPQYQDVTLAPSTTAGGTAMSQDQMRPYRGYSTIQQQWGRGWRTHHSLQLSFQRRFRNGFSFGFNDTITLYDRQAAGARLQHSSDGAYSIRSDQAEAERLFGNVNTPPHILKGNVVWDLPDLKSHQPVLRVLGLVVNDWVISSIWSGGRFDPNVNPPSSVYTVGYGYQNGGNTVNLTGSQDYGARVRVVGDPGSGCSRDPYRQFKTDAFEGPLVGSVGLESSNNYLHQCFISTLDLSIARNIRLGGPRQLQLRIDMFNAPNAAGITGRNSTINLTNPNDPVTITNLPFLPTGELDPNRWRPRGAGFGVATNYQNPRRVQAQVRLSF